MKFFNGFTQNDYYSLMSNGRGQQLGEGSHGDVYALGADLVIKYFKRDYYDYIALEQLQDNEFAPILYAYKEKNFVIMERINGITLKDYLRINKQLPPNIDILVEKMIRSFASDGWDLVDMKMEEHIYWIDALKTIKYIDYGVIDNISHLLPNNKSFYDMVVENSVTTALEELNRANKFKVFV